VALNHQVGGSIPLTPTSKKINLGCRLTAGHKILVLGIGVRIPAPQPGSSEPLFSDNPTGSGTSFRQLCWKSSARHAPTGVAGKRARGSRWFLPLLM
jgi:hypothetical protein